MMLTEMLFRPGCWRGVSIHRVSPNAAHAPIAAAVAGAAEQGAAVVVAFTVATKAIIYAISRPFTLAYLRSGCATLCFAHGGCGGMVDQVHHPKRQ